MLFESLHRSTDQSKAIVQHLEQSSEQYNSPLAIVQAIVQHLEQSSEQYNSLLAIVQHLEQSSEQYNSPLARLCYLNPCTEVQIILSLIII